MRKRTVAVAVAALAAAGATAALASDHRDRGEREEHRSRGERRSAARGSPADPEGRALYRKECGACHLDFPPGLLPAESHRRTLAGLERHFGQNAELDPEVRARLERWLVENSAESGAWRRSRRVLASLGKEAPSRITEVPWFRREHRGVDAAAAAHPRVRSLANCGACHPGARDWDFDDDGAKIPPG
jgi:ferric-dicitrate binding protein FerR (iron transport regulator)